MNYLKSFNENYIAKICEEFRIENWSIRDGLVDVDGDVNLVNRGLEKIPLKFGRVSGDFHCSFNGLTNLEGAPGSVRGSFYCNVNNLVTLEGAPQSVRGDFYCQGNNLVTLEGAPGSVGGNFYCHGNPIYGMWELFGDFERIEFFNDLDIVREIVDGKPSFVLDRLNFFLLLKKSMGGLI